MHSAALLCSPQRAPPAPKRVFPKRSRLCPAPDIRCRSGLVMAVNSDGVGATSLVWKQFSVSFVAASELTKIAFINGDPPGDNSNFLDDVVLR